VAKTSPKILVLDIETAPAISYIWRMFDETVGLEQLLDPGRVICAAWQWYGTKEVHFGSEWDTAIDSTDWLLRLHDAMSAADAVVTFNGNKFDLPKLNGEFIRLGLAPPAPSASIDLRVTSKKLGYISGKLAFLGPHLKIGAKVKHEGFELWKKVLAGDSAARVRMERYNKQDTRLTTRLYKKLRPYIKNHPYLHETPPTACPTCGSSKTQHRGTRRTKSFEIDRHQCQGCGSWFDGKRKKMGVKK
jgi:hypothetical protein